MLSLDGQGAEDDRRRIDVSGDERQTAVVADEAYDAALWIFDDAGEIRYGDCMLC